MEYETYIDESGNTGNDLMNNSQKFFCLSAVSIPLSQAESLEKYIQREFESVKEKGEKEIKATRWIKNDKKNKVLQDIIKVLCSFYFFFFVVAPCIIFVIVICSIKKIIYN